MLIWLVEKKNLLFVWGNLQEIWSIGAMRGEVNGASHVHVMSY
jgi:hypothetical protein